MIGACERLRAKKTIKQDDFSILEMRFEGGMILSLIGANSPASLSHRPVRFLFSDEINKFPAFAGKETDPMSLSAERTKNFWNRKIFDVSTPSTDTGNITKQLNSCQAIFDFWAPCPFCGSFQKLIFEQIKWPKRDENSEEGAACIDKIKIWHGMSAQRTAKKLMTFIKVK